MWLDELLSKSDIVVITIPYDDSSSNLINEEKIDLLKQWVIIVNISSHEILSEEALINKLKSWDIAWYGLDNFANKDKDHFFYNTNRVMILPHLWFFSQESLDMIGVRMLEGYNWFLAWESINKVL